MARDYARRRPARRILTAGVSAPRTGKRGRSHAALKHLPYLAVGMLMGLLIAGFFYVKMQPQQVAQQLATTAEPAKPQTAKHKTPQTVAQKPKTQPRYDFYTILTHDKATPSTEEDIKAEETAETDDSEAAPIPKINTAAAPKVEPTPPKHVEPAAAKIVSKPTGKYVLQVAALKKHEDADRLKARLILQGYDVFISKPKIKNVQWYRVNVGPYRTTGNAKAQQKRLKANNINSLLLTV
ncbi:MAG: SPOR domain-containing protein [Pseudomonadota bacterium]|nr:SPOR domain-containing protein [Pseudomonadota bacterium]